MKKSDTAKLGLGVIGVGIIGYGLYSMKKDTEKLFNAPGNFIDGLFGPEGVLGGSGLPGVETEPVKRFIDDTIQYITKPEEIAKAKNAEIYVDNPDQTTRTQYGTVGPLGGFTDMVTKGPIGVLGNVIADIGSTINPMPDDLKSTQTKYASGNFGVEDIAGQDSVYRKLFIKKSPGTPQGANVADIKSHQQAVSMGLGLAPLAVNAQSTQIPTKYTEKASTTPSNSYTDSTGRTYTPTNVIVAKAKWL